MNRVQQLLQDSLNVVNRMPQGAPQIDSQTYPDECDPTHPFHFDFYLASDVVIVNRCKLSFFLRAFRSPVASVNTATSGASSASSSASGAAHSHTIGGIATDNGNAFHSHTTAINAGAGAAGNVTAGNGPASALFVVGIAAGSGVDTNGVNTIHSHTITGQTSGSESTHAHNIPHTHDVTPTLAYGIFEGAVATGVTVKVNGVDRTAALGGGSGFTANQTELALNLAWINRGAWNTIDLTPSGLGRITGHLTVVSYIQSA